ncbi:effector-associated domain EAD1-containing protein [Streptomyces sp. NPDC029526]|uniref:effector-associated domain EAD1-containing protein n=1 Tax=Streptomyces sp. NPDC029526 TaxID=3155728 RepID=UPI0033FFDF76
MTALLDEGAFHLDDKRAKELLKALTAVYPERRTARELIVGAGLRAADIHWDTCMADVWPEALEKAAAGGHLRTLVARAASDVNTAAYPVFEYLLTEEPSAPEAEPSAAHLVSNRQRAFFNRVSFRSTLHQMVTGEGKRVLAVQGPRRVGRTHGWYLIAHVLGSHRVDCRRIRMSDYLSPARVKDIADTLQELFGWPLTIDPHTSEDSQARRLVHLIEHQMNGARDGCDAKDGHWLVIDDSESVRFTEPALRALTRLVTAVVEDEMADRLRIVLLAYDGWLPSDLYPYVSHEEFGPLLGRDLHAYVAAVTREAGRPADDEEVLGLANELSNSAGGGDVVADAPLPVPDRLQVAAASWAREQYGRGR